MNSGSRRTLQMESIFSYSLVKNFTFDAHTVDKGYSVDTDKEAEYEKEMWAKIIASLKLYKAANPEGEEC